MKFSETIEIITECRDILELSLKLLKSDFTFIDEDSSVLMDNDGCLYSDIEKSLRPELERVVNLLKKL